MIMANLQYGITTMVIIANVSIEPRITSRCFTDSQKLEKVARPFQINHCRFDE